MKTIYTDIYFDLDHTLWDFEKNSALAMQTILEKNNIQIDINNFLQFYVPINFQYWDWYRNEKISQAELRLGRLKDTFGLLDYHITDDEILTLSDQYIEFLPTFNHLFEGALDILEYLKPKYNLHIITNGFADVQTNKIKNAGIESYFTTITNSEMAGVKKPNPKIFDFALALNQTNKKSAMMIGDCMDADVGGALNFGMDAIYFNEHFKEIPANIKQVNYLIDLKKYL